MWAKAELHPCSWKGRVSRAGGEVGPKSSAVWGFLTLQGVMGQLQVDPLSARSFFQLLVSGCQPQRMLSEASEILFPEPTLPAAALEGRRARGSAPTAEPHIRPGFCLVDGVKRVESSRVYVTRREERGPRTGPRAWSKPSASCAPAPSVSEVYFLYSTRAHRAGPLSQLRVCALDRLAHSGCFAEGMDEPCGVRAGPGGCPLISPVLAGHCHLPPLTPSRLRDSTELPLKSQSRVS